MNGSAVPAPAQEQSFADVQDQIAAMAKAYLGPRPWPADLAKLREPFPAEDVEWRIQRSGFKNRQPWAVVVPYIDNRAIQDRLDTVCAPENWCNKFEARDGGVLCGLGIRIAGEWVWKWDGAENTDFEPFKGGLSGSMKRAAVQWGIGRYLYSMPAGHAVFCDQGKYRDEIKEIKDKQVIRREWLRWNPPSLPAAAPGNGNGNGKGNGHQPGPESQQEDRRPLPDQIKDILDCGLFSKEQKNAGYSALNAVRSEDAQSLLNLRNLWASRKKEAEESARKARNPQPPAGATAGVPAPEGK